MLSAVIVDDEIPVLNLLKMFLQKTEQVNILGAYTEPNEALKNIINIKPDVVFLDIEMPEMNGLELASRLIEQNDELMVVFFTGYNQYALEAFQVYGNNGIVKWPTRKVEEMFAYFIVHRDSNVEGDLLGEILWPEEEPDKIKSNLHTSLYRLRKTIKENGLPIEISSKKGGNGVKFTIKGTVTLSAEEKGDFIKISVEDTGIGIPKEKQGKLFYAFSQAEEETSIQYGGSGLGLYISRQLLKRMNGQIFLEWSELNKGTCFSFLLPKTKGEPVNKKTIIESSLEEAVGTIVDKKLDRNFKILAVDDKATNLRALKSIFHDREYEILTASNGTEAIEIVNTQKDIDLVLMDVMMPGISGYEACRKIREQHSSYDLPIVILTVRDTPEDITAGFDAGANDFVTKPFVAKELRARVSNLIQMKKSVHKALKNEMAFLQSQIKPHFLYNAISTIMSFCYTDGARAGELLAYLSQYLQKSFNIDNTSTTVSLENELELTKAYTEIQKSRFGERLTVEYDIDDSLMEQRILPLIIQPLVENSIRHGLMKRKNGGIVKITV